MASKDMIAKIILKGQTDPSLQKAFQNASKLADTNIDKLKQFGATAAKVSKAAAAAVGAGVVASAKSAIDYESSFANVMKTVEETGTTSYDKLSAGIRNMSKEMPQSAAAIAEVAGMAGQLGIKADDLLGFTETMINLGETTNLSSEDAATSIAKLFNITGTSMDKASNFGSTLVALGNNAATTESDIMNMASRIAASGSQIGLTEPQILAMATSLSSVGMEAEAGGTAISTVMTKIDKSVATNDNALKTWAATAGMSTSQFKTMWETDAYGAMQKVIQGMGDVEKGGGNLNLILEELGITGIREADTMKRLSNASGMMSDMTNLANKAWGENTALSKEAAVRYETMAAKIQIFKNKIVDAGITLGNRLMPYLDKLIDKMSEIDFEGIANKFGNAIDWIADHSTTLVTILGMVAGAFVGIKILGFIKGLVSAVKVVMTVVKAFGFLKVALAFLGGPVTIVIGLIAALVGGFVALWLKSEKFRNFWKGLWNGIKTAAKTVGDWLKNLFTVTIPAAWDTFKNKCIQVGGAIKTFFTQTIPQAFNTAVNWIKSLPSKIGTFITNTITKINNWRLQMLAKAKEIGTGFVNAVVNFFKQLPSKIGYVVGLVLGKLATWAVQLYNFATTKIPQFINAVVNWFKQLPSKIWTWLVNTISKINAWGNKISTIARTKAKQFVTNAINYIKTLPSKIWTWLVNTIQKVTAWGNKMSSIARTKAMNFVKTVVNFIKQLPSKIWSFLLQCIQKVTSWGTQLVAKGKAAATKLKNAIVEKVKEIPSKLVECGKSIVQGLWKGITGAGSWLKDRIKSFASGVVKGFKDSFKVGSPAKVLADEVGKWIPAGLGVGMLDNVNAAIKSAQKVGSLVTGATAAAAGIPVKSSMTASNIRYSTPAQATANGGANLIDRGIQQAGRRTGGDIYNFTFAPVVSGGNAEENRKMLKDEQAEFEKRMNIYLKKKGRVAFA